MRPLDMIETEKLRQLQRVKLLATLILLACFCVMVAAKLLEQHYSQLAIVAAFAEAATIGGIADWYAVVALFKRPLNLPFPHTAIIPRNQPRIADNLGRFIESNFLARGPVEAKLREVDFAGEVARWLSRREQSESLARFAMRFLPQLLQAVEDRGLARFAAQRFVDQVSKTDIAPLLGNVIEAFTKDGRHHALLDDLIKALHRFLGDEATMAVLRDKVQSELPTFFTMLGADNLILNRILRSATELLDEVQEDPAHPLRMEFETFLTAYLDRTRHSKGFATQVERAKQMILARPEIDGAAENLWRDLKDYVLHDIENNESLLISRLTDLLVDVGTSLEGEPNLRRDINSGMVTVLASLIEEQRGGIARYVSEQVKGWNMAQLLTLLEVNVGQDLQYIRFNGMIIGGCVGVVLYAVERMLLL